MKLPSSRAAIAALALVFTVALAGCEDEDGPGSTPTPDSPSVPETSSPTEPTTSVTETGPVEPVEVVRAWVSALNLTLRGGSEAEAAAFEAANCWTCREHIDPVIRALERGGWFRGGRWSVTRARVADRNAQRASVYAAISAAAGITLTRAGTEPTRYEAEKFILDFELERSSSGWLISKIVYLS